MTSRNQKNKKPVTTCSETMANQRRLVETCADFSINSFSRQIPAMVVLGLPSWTIASHNPVSNAFLTFSISAWPCLALLGRQWMQLSASLQRSLRGLPGACDTRLRVTAWHRWKLWGQSSYGRGDPILQHIPTSLTFAVPKHKDNKDKSA